MGANFFGRNQLNFFHGSAVKSKNTLDIVA